MKKIFSLIVMAVFGTLVSCSEDYDTAVAPESSVSFEHAVRTAAFTDDNNTYDVKVGVTQKSNVDRTFQIETLTGNDPAGTPYSTALEGDFTVSSTSVTIPAGELFGNFTITFDPALDLTASRYASFKVVTPESGYVVNKTKEIIKINYNRVCFSNTVVFNLVLDPWGTETTWNIKNTAGTVVQQGGPYADGNGLQPQPAMTFTLEDGSYTFTINDAYGDGLSGSTTSGPGSYTLAKDCGTSLANGSGNFGVSATHTFSIP